MSACQCTIGCEGETQSTFTMGHDARYRERMLTLLREGKLSLYEVEFITEIGYNMPGLFRQIKEKFALGQAA